MSQEESELLKEMLAEQYKSRNILTEEFDRRARLFAASLSIPTVQFSEEIVNSLAEYIPSIAELNCEEKRELKNIVGGAAAVLMAKGILFREEQQAEKN